MPKVHSHYENLKVARDASADDIRTAYRALTRKHHPDRNLGNRDSERVMAVINVAYGVLSDAARRSEHDRWIEQAESPTARPARHAATLHAPADRYRPASASSSPASSSSPSSSAISPEDRATAARARQQLLEQRVRRAAAHVAQHRAPYALACAALVGAFGFGAWELMRPGLSLPMTAAAVSTVRPAAGYQRAPTAPNGRAWPARSGYVDGYPQTNAGGLSEVMVDNSQGDADMLAKLVSLDGPSPLPVRVVFVASHSRFVVRGLTIGTYDLRYRNLASGSLLRSPAFILEEFKTAGVTQHSMPNVKLYDIDDGSLRAYALGDADF